MESEIIENIKWLRGTENSIISHHSWLKIGRRPTTMVNESKFCDPQILSEILNLKSEFDKLHQKTLMQARSTCNPFEKIGRSIFKNRAAVKMANLDAVLDYMFTEPTTDLSYFADICAGPGGFSEYILWRTKNQTKGFGFTLRGENDFNLNASSDIFECYYGYRNDGNILDPENIWSLKNYITQKTQGALVDFMMADGGFYVYDENIQEIISKQLYLCQCLVGLSIVRHGGNAVIKLFDCFTMFTVGLIFLMYKSFGKICIVKPNSSRPANSERYLVCKHKKSNINIIEQYLIQVNEQMWYNKAEVLELVSNEVMSQDQNFIKYILESNNSIGQKQINALSKIIELITTGRTQVVDQEKLKHCCLRAWKLPIQQQVTVI